MGPIIGILIRSGSNENNTPMEYCFESTRRALIKSGGVPFFLTPPQDIDYFTTKNSDFPILTGVEKEIICYQLEQLDGLFIPGGVKMTQYDYFVLDECLKRNIPVLGVCLGMQIIANYKTNNFNLEPVTNINIHYQEDYHLNAHNIKIEKDSLLYKIIGQDEIMVNSHHKQCITYTKSCNITAKSTDDVIEAIELKDYDFCLGVQWHPEITIETDLNSKKIFASFLEKAKIHQLNHKKQQKNVDIA